MHQIPRLYTSIHINTLKYPLKYTYIHFISLSSNHIHFSIH